MNETMIEAPVREEASGTHEFSITLTDPNSTVEIDKYNCEVVVEEW